VSTFASEFRCVAFALLRDGVWLRALETWRSGSLLAHRPLLLWFVSLMRFVALVCACCFGIDVLSCVSMSVPRCIYKRASERCRACVDVETTFACVRRRAGSPLVVLRTNYCVCPVTAEHKSAAIESNAFIGFRFRCVSVAACVRERVGGCGIAVCKIVTWLILPVVICLSQRLSHACLSINRYTVKLRMAH